jgi:hypothetical protein
MSLTVELDLHIDRCRRGQKVLQEGETPALAPPRLPRVTKLLALAHRFDALIRAGQFRDYAQIAAVGQVTRARLSQIMTLLNLAPGIQEEILFLPRVERGRDPIILADLMPIACELIWRRQRRLWQALRAKAITGRGLIPATKPLGRLTSSTASRAVPHASVASQPGP